MKYKMSESVMKMRSLIKDATIEQFKRKQQFLEDRREKCLPHHINLRNFFALTAILWISFLLFPHIMEFMRTSKLKKDNRSFESFIGNKIGDIVSSRSELNDVKTIVVLISRCNENYSTRVNSLCNRLKGGDSSVNTCWAADEGGYSLEDEPDEHIDKALSSYPETGILILLSTGRIFEKRCSTKLKSFIRQGGALVIISDGETAPLMENPDLKSGKTIMIARRQTGTGEKIFNSDFDNIFNQKYEVINF